MRLRFKGLFSTAIAIAIGAIILLGALLPVGGLVAIRAVLLQWAVILAAVALVVGVFNLLRVHYGRISAREKGSFYSILLVVFMLITVTLGLFLGPTDPTVMLLFNAIQVPVEASLTAVLAVTLLYASVRLLRWRTDLVAVIFIATAVVILLGTAPLPFLGSVPVLGDLIRPFVAQVLAAGGARGILMGVALGTLTTGLRILFGADRPYGSK